MSIAAALDLANGTLDRIAPDLDANFHVMPTLYPILQQKGHVRFEGGRYLKFPFTYGAAGKAIGVFNGPEILTKGRDQKHQSLEYELHRMVYTVSIPNKELIHNQGDLAIIDLMEQYPANDMECWIQDEEDYLLTGVSGGLAASTAALSGLMTLNGEKNPNKLRGVTNGMLDFALPTAQSDVVGNIAKSDSQKHANQYATISTWASNGLKTEKRTLRKCAKNGNHKDAQSYVLVMDDLKYGNFEEERESRVRVRMVNDALEKDATYSLPLMGAEVHHSLHLDTTQFTGDGQNGVTYHIDTDHMFCQVAEDRTLKGKDFKEAEDQDMVYLKVPCHKQYGMRRLSAHGVTAGGN